MIEGSRTGSGYGSIPLTNGSGSGSRRPKNTWIRRIRIRITAHKAPRMRVESDLELVGEPDALHELHVDETGILLLDLLELPVRRVGHPGLAVRRHADQVRHDLEQSIHPLIHQSINNHY
jgi:hypothetical protein